MRVRLVIPLGLAAALWATGCGHVTKVRPTPSGQVAVEGAFGGPFGQVEGYVLPLPLATVGASYGIAERFDVEAHAHLTSLVFGVAGLDVGGSWLALAQQGAIPAVSLNGRLYGFTDLRAARAYLEVSPSVSYLLGEHFLTYVSATGWVQFAGGPPLFTVAAGEEFQLGKWGLQLEARWYAPDYGTENLPTRWANINGLGGFGVLLGVRYRFGGEP
ncbi:MAG TPA: hypothetical protein VK447_07325 [Myxococcaceae bacterium]|nr:hypothetical protein [Myxococcaceae bacterium]